MVTTKRKPIFFKFPAMIRPRMTKIHEFLREIWYVQHSLNRRNLLLNMSVANFLRTLLCSTVADIFNTLGGIFEENLLNKNCSSGYDFHINWIRLRKYLIANSFA